MCLGIKLVKIQLSSDLLLDACRRCGGIWFDDQEVQALRAVRPHVLWTHVVPTPVPHVMKCHACRASLDTNARKCAACGWNKRIACPVCTTQMTLYTTLRLDACKHCKGVWFDNADLATIWNGQLDNRVRKEFDEHQEPDTVPLFLDIVEGIGPFFPVDGVDVTGPIVQVAGDIMSNATGVAGAAIDGGADLAGTVFEGIAAIVGGICDGF